MSCRRACRSECHISCMKRGCCICKWSPEIASFLRGSAARPTLAAQSLRICKARDCLLASSGAARGSLSHANDSKHKTRPHFAHARAFVPGPRDGRERRHMHASTARGIASEETSLMVLVGQSVNACSRLGDLSKCLVFTYIFDLNSIPGLKQKRIASV